MAWHDGKARKLGQGNARQAKARRRIVITIITTLMPCYAMQSIKAHKWQFCASIISSQCVTV